MPSHSSLMGLEVIIISAFVAIGLEDLGGIDILALYTLYEPAYSALGELVDGTSLVSYFAVLSEGNCIFAALGSMDPFTTLSAAGNVLQFLQFVGSLLNSTRKLHASASGITVEHEHVHDIYSKLIVFNESLQRRYENDPQGATTKASIHGPEIASCASACQQDCEELLRIVTKLRIKSDSRSRYWRSFQAALTEVWNSGEIKDLKERIAERQRAITLQLCAISSENILTIGDRLQRLHRNIEIWNNGNGRHKMLKDTKDLLARRVDKLYKQESVNAEEIDSICQDLSRLSLSARDYEQEFLITASLDYEERPIRHDNIVQAHKTTFGWGLNEVTNDSEKFASLRRWLPGPNGLFWVSGKPGSGKSTFMKFIADHKTTREYLEQWAGSRELLITSHYFTIYGTPIQRSLDGLLRSLLHGIFRGQPNLIPRLLPTRWHLKSAQPSWTQRELLDVLQHIAEETDVPVNICIFIDGLDEYTGDHFDICQTLIKLSQAPFMKICVSSRPWNVFKDALGGTPDSVLFMHELTYDDIHSYTEDMLRKHPRWTALEEEASLVSSESLIEEVVEKSNGVFLWVTLVVRLLREGLTNDDSMSDLRRMLSSFPADLKKFFRHILESVDPFYNDRMARTLQIALRADKPLFIEMFMFADLEYDDDNYAFKAPDRMMPATLPDMTKMFASVSRRINGRCKGLLERDGDRMQFLHRTVYDFLHTPEMTSYLTELAKPGFCPDYSLFQASVAWTKRSKFNDLRRKDSDESTFRWLESHSFVQRMRQVLQYARSSEKAGERSAALTAALLDNMEASIETMVENGQILMGDQATMIRIYRQLVIEAGIDIYANKKLALPGYITADHAAAFLPLCLFERELNLMERQDSSFLQGILRSIPNPNALYGKQSIWSVFLDKCVPEQPEGGSEKLRHFLESGVLYTLLQHGADTKILIDTSTIGVSHYFKIPAWLGIIFTIQATATPVHEEMYEQVLDHLLKNLQNVGKVKVASNSGNNILEWHDFWDVCESHFPGYLKGPNESLIISTFSESLQRARGQSAILDSVYYTACRWVQSGLSENGQKQFDSALSALEVQHKQKTTLKRKSRSHTPKGRQRKVTRRS